MELTDWQLQRMEDALSFIMTQRAAKTGTMPEVVVLQVTDDTSKSIVIKVSNAILNQTAKNPNFVVVLYINQCNRDGLLHELLDELALRDYSKVFFIDELIANPISSRMVPNHELCTHKMVKKLLQKYSITIDSLPKMLLRDPIVRWYGWQVGDVVKITRPNGELYYRMVVEKAF
jgi:DNA-directed RNA polymerase subunit H (RpoH/RPB5)